MPCATLLPPCAGSHHSKGAPTAQLHPQHCSALSYLPINPNLNLYFLGLPNISDHPGVNPRPPPHHQHSFQLRMLFQAPLQQEFQMLGMRRDSCLAFQALAPTSGRHRLTDRTNCSKLERTQEIKAEKAEREKWSWGRSMCSKFFLTLKFHGSFRRLPKIKQKLSSTRFPHSTP